MQDRTADSSRTHAPHAKSVAHLTTDAPIGIFDSGVGGLTVVGALLKRFPDERVLYVADQAHVPYGGRPLEEVQAFATGISRFLAGEDCKAIVMACNISSAVALPYVRECLSPLPVFGVIEPAVRRAAVGDAPRIGVLATAGTVKSGAYTAQIRTADPAAFVTEVACPDFVPLVEAGELESSVAQDAARRYLTPLAELGCSTIILGCTHYPFLLPVLRRQAASLIAGPVRFIDPADEIASVIERSVPLRVESGLRDRNLLTTGDPSAFRAQVPRFLPSAEAEVTGAVWTGPGLLQIL